MPGDRGIHGQELPAVTFWTSTCSHVSTAPLTEDLSLDLRACHALPRQPLPTVLGLWAASMLGGCYPCPHTADIPWRRPTVNKMPQKVACWEESKTGEGRLWAGLSKRCPEVPLKEEQPGRRVQQQNQAGGL